jgi:hypothetical protein
MLRTGPNVRSFYKLSGATVASAEAKELTVTHRRLAGGALTLKGSKIDGCSLQAEALFLESLSKTHIMKAGKRGLLKRVPQTIMMVSAKADGPGGRDSEEISIGFTVDEDSAAAWQRALLE